MAVVEATSSTAVSYTSNVNEKGDFLIMGLPPGMYTITITPALPLLPVTKTNVVVTAGLTTEIGAFIIL
jgi:hypothetical protein